MIAAIMEKLKEAYGFKPMVFCTAPTVPTVPTVPSGQNVFEARAV
jgi:hypothetical protein